jgi:hypothetical protein
MMFELENNLRYWDVQEGRHIKVFESPIAGHSEILWGRKSILSLICSLAFRDDHMGNVHGSKGETCRQRHHPGDDFRDQAEFLLHTL